MPTELSHGTQRLHILTLASLDAITTSIETMTTPTQVNTSQWLIRESAKDVIPHAASAQICMEDKDAATVSPLLLSL